MFLSEKLNKPSCIYEILDSTETRHTDFKHSICTFKAYMVQIQIPSNDIDIAFVYDYLLVSMFYFEIISNVKKLQKIVQNSCKSLTQIPLVCIYYIITVQSLTSGY